MLPFICGGFGEAVLFALSLNPGRIVLALGGSASTDGGMGMLTALGYIFRDAGGRQLDGSGRDLARIHSVARSPLAELAGTELVVASDVQTPLLGGQGAAAVFGPQKARQRRTSLSSTRVWSTSWPK